MKDELSYEAVALGDDDAVKQILAEICAITGMGFAAVARVTEDRWIACQVEDQIDFGLEAGAELEVRKTICNEIRESGEPVLIDNTDTHHDWWNHPVPVLYGFHSYVSLPIQLKDGRFFGTLCALDPAPRDDHLHDHLAQLEALAARIAMILSTKMAEPQHGPRESETPLA